MKHQLLRRYIAPIFFGVLVFLALLSSFPLVRPVPFSDSADFTYIASQMMNGKILYVDVWDNKPPLVFIINMTGLLLGRGSVWGVWLVEYCTILLSTFLCFFILKKQYGTIASFLSTLLFIISVMFCYQDGNSVEQYTLLLQFVFIYLLLKTQNIKYKAYLLGVITALLFMLRPNLIGISVASLLFYSCDFFIATKIRKALIFTIKIFLGICIGLSPFLVLFVIQHSLTAFISAVFIHEVAYSITSMSNRFSAAWYGLFLLSITGIALYAFGGTVFLLKEKKKNIFSEHKLEIFSLVWLIIELGMASISGRTYKHYYLPLLPPMTILTAFFISKISNYFKKKSVTQKLRFQILILITILILFHTIMSALTVLSEIRINKIYEQRQKELLHVLRPLMKDNKYLLIWGYNVDLYIVTEKKPISKFLAQQILLTKNYSSKKHIDEYLSAIEKNKPVIIDTTTLDGTIPPVDGSLRSLWVSKYDAYEQPQRMNSIYNYIQRSYTVTAKGDNWTIYTMKKKLSKQN